MPVGRSFDVVVSCTVTLKKNGLFSRQQFTPHEARRTPVRRLVQTFTPLIRTQINGSRPPKADHQAAGFRSATNSRSKSRRGGVAMAFPAGHCVTALRSDFRREARLCGEKRFKWTAPAGQERNKDRTKVEDWQTRRISDDQKAKCYYFPEPCDTPPHPEKLT